MTIAEVLSDMQVLDNELDIGSGGADETRAITAIGMGYRAFEGVIANIPKMRGTVSTIATAADTETTAWPSTLLRLDDLYLLDANGRQRWQVRLIQDVGGQEPGILAAFLGVAAASSGAPREAFVDSANFYWSPRPDAVHTLRVFGLFAKTRPALRTDTFQYPDLVSLPMAAYAVRLMEMGIDDPSEELKALAEETFNPAIKALSRPTRQRPQSRHYSQVHTT